MLRKTRNDVIREIDRAHAPGGSGQPDLYHWDLQGTDLSGLNLSCAKIFAANLKDVNLSNAYLKGTEFNDSNLKNANLSGAYLCKAKLTGTDLENTNFKWSYLHKTDFRGVPNFRNTQFKGAFVANAMFGVGDLRRTDIQKAIFQVEGLAEPLRTLIRTQDQDEHTSSSTVQRIWARLRTIPRQAPMFQPGSQLPEGFNPSEPNHQHQQNWMQQIFSLFTSVGAWLFGNNSEANTQHFPAYIILDKYNLSDNSNLQKVLSPGYNNAGFISGYSQLVDLKLDHAIYIQELIEDPALAQIFKEHQSLFLQLNELGLSQAVHIKALLNSPEKSTLAKIFVETGLEKSIESCQQRSNESKLRMALFFQSKVGNAPLEVVLKNAASALQQKSGYLAAKSYTAAEPYLEKARVLLNIPDHDWRAIFTANYASKVNQRYQNHHSLYYENNPDNPEGNFTNASAPPIEDPIQNPNNPQEAMAPLSYFGQHTNHTGHTINPADSEAPPPPYSERHLYPLISSAYSEGTPSLYPSLLYHQQHTTNNTPVQPSAPPYAASHGVLSTG
ncbi:Type III effector pipB2 [Piscirickettsia salmonis]|uniref:Pentapeptide repeats family protein n=2 Tax=Piscirickettsia salmonis TaxID=1238 RepID=A0A1L6TGJ4_PISSA|nr:pentapeptide repeat-containing protein [Piscirickettsia salmonis]AKP72859.2 hypothetical protein PSLF89_768 [Piscirickettsia salmonis LF-89 = ATCC VR-1361]ALB21475.1 pentapeptide repeats family protein [Piscirickettsia salmonis]ALY01698.1 hypothetical protein AWE47_01450 [Piscirickettsia salmonis]AMA41214.1 hypothetical protein AWJ11_01460 [Piscirickettsia salmonis]AOS36403.1 hypothetical protein AVM72_14445 [Piscirickettsia salmonis]